MFFRLASGAGLFGKSDVGGFGVGPDEVMRPVHQKEEQSQLQGEDDDRHQQGQRLQKADTGTEAGMRRDEILELDAGLADDQHVVVGEADRVDDGLAVAFNERVGGKTGQIDTGAAFLEAGVPGGQKGVVGQQQMTLRILADQR